MTTGSGVGSWPGDRAREAVRTVRDLLVDRGLPYLPELPARGPGSDLLGRGAGMLVELPVELRPSGWRLADRPGRDARRTASMLGEDLDELTEAYDGYVGPLKLQVAGPWTLAAGVELPRGERMLTDEGACRDLAGSLAEGVRRHVERVQALVPGAELVVQVDEPSLPAVLAGRLPTASGYGRVRAVDPQVAGAAIQTVLHAVEGRRTVVHCCASGIPLPLLRQSGAGAVALDTALLSAAGWESVAATVESGTGLYAGCLPTEREVPSGQAARELARRWEELGLDGALLHDLVVTPACGLAGLDVRAAVHRQRQALEVAEELEGLAAS